MYSVRWKPSATNELAELWVNADSGGRRLLTESVREAEMLLRDDPREPASRAVEMIESCS